MTFINSADSRETSQEIISAIDALANNDEHAIGIWNDPSPQEIESIWEAVTINGEIPSTAFYWGEASNRWYQTTTLKLVSDSPSITIDSGHIISADGYQTTTESEQ